MEVEASAVTASGAVPEVGVTLSAAVGPVTAAVTVTGWVVVAVRPLASVTVTVTV